MPTPTHRLTVAAVGVVPAPTLTLTGDADAILAAAALLGKPVDVTDPDAAAAQEESPNQRRAVTLRALSLMERFGFDGADISVTKDYSAGGYRATCQVYDVNALFTVFAGRTASARSSGHGWVTVAVVVDGVEFVGGRSHPKLTFDIAKWIVGTPLPTTEEEVAARSATEPAGAPEGDVEVVS